MAAISTRSARVMVTDNASGTTQVILATRWVVEARADEIDVTNFESGGYTEFLASYIEADISVDGFYELGGVPFVTPAVITSVMPGNRVELFLYASRSTAGLNDFFLFPVAVVLSMSGATAVRDAARVSFRAKNVGVFYYPGGIAFAGVDEFG